MKTRFSPRKVTATAAPTGVQPTTLASMLPAAWVRPAHWPAMAEPAVNSAKLLYRMSAEEQSPITLRTGANAANITVSGTQLINGTQFASARHWRINITANNGDPFTTLKEVQFVKADNSLVNRTSIIATQSSAYRPTDSAADLVDGNTTSDDTSAWATAVGQAVPSWVAFDLGSAQAIKRIEIMPQSFNLPARAPRDFTIQSSTNGVDWTTVKTVVGAALWVADTYRAIELPSTDGTLPVYNTGTNDTTFSLFPDFHSNTNPVAADGYKYCEISITPASTPLTMLRFDSAPTGYINASYLPTNGYVEVIVNMPTLTTLAMHGAATTGRLNPALEHVRFMAVNASMAYSQMFYKMTSLRKITCDLGYLDVRQHITETFTDCVLLTDFPKIIITSVAKINATSAYQGCKSMLGLPDINYDRIGVAQYMFQDCWNLLEAGNNVFAGATNVGDMLRNCYALQWKDATVDIPYATTVSGVFTGCTNITKLPNINLPLATTLGVLLSSCNNLTEVGNIHAPVATSAYGLLSNNTSLLKVGNVNLPLAANVDQLFYGNYRLRQVGTITTSASLVSMNSMYCMCGEMINPVMPSNTQNVSSANSLFAYCRNMVKAPVLNLLATSCNSSNMFQECNKMVDASQVRITFAITASSMYANCSAMTKPATAGYVYANTAPSFATGCRSLQRFPPGVLSISRAFSVANSGLTTAGLNAMFTSLPTAYNFGSEAITITGCPGAATCNRTIATDKGWTVVG